MSRWTDPSRYVGHVPGQQFRYEQYVLEDSGDLTCHYSLDGRAFTERINLGAGADRPAVRAAARLVFLLAGISYYKTAAPPVIDLGDTAVTELERSFLRDYYVEGLGEYAYKNDLDLTGLTIEGPEQTQSPVGIEQTGRPLVPFGGGIDSIVVVEATRKRHADTALFVASRAGARFEAIEQAAAVTGLPIKRADREVDEQVLRSSELGFLNGHVPVTGIVSALAVMAALIDDRDAVVMSNEWSASSPTLEAHGRSINHQWSKSLDFEASFRDVLAQSVDGFTYFSALRPYSELWVARRFATLTDYHPAFRSCNRSFHLDPARRLDHWCGECDKCCFIDLILAPFLDRDALAKVFGGREPLERADLEPRFVSLLGDAAVT
ncbi:MAG: hypothetical protein JWM40_1958 [Frankiales bacterium]|nr:hypothetical protein [Frankiales bacterium]